MKHDKQFKKGATPWNKGGHHSEEAKRKMSLANIGKSPWNKGVKTGIAPWRGKIRDEATRLKISLAKLGKPSWNKGKKLTPEHIEKLAASHRGKPLTLEHRKKISTTNKGENSYLWKGGITAKNYQIRHSFEYRLWRESVFKRDNYTCIWCNARCGNGKKITLQADHIKPFSLFPELRFAIDNGRTLCADCHRKTDTFGSNIKYYK